MGLRPAWLITFLEAWDILVASHSYNNHLYFFQLTASLPQIPSFQTYQDFQSIDPSIFHKFSPLDITCLHPMICYYDHPIAYAWHSLVLFSRLVVLGQTTSLGNTVSHCPMPALVEKFMTATL